MGQNTGGLKAINLLIWLLIDVVRFDTLKEYM